MALEADLAVVVVVVAGVQTAEVAEAMVFKMVSLPLLWSVS